MFGQLNKWPNCACHWFRWELFFQGVEWDSISTLCNKKRRVQKSYSPCTRDHRPSQLRRCKSISHLQTSILSRFGLSSCSLTVLFGNWRPTNPATQHSTQHTFLVVTPTQIHQRKSSCFIHRSYIHPDSTGIVFPTQILQQKRESDSSSSPCSLSSSPRLLQHELNYLSDAAEDHKHSQALSYRALLFSSPSISPNLSHPPKNYSLLACLIYLLTICHTLHSVLSSIFSPKIVSFSVQTSDPFSSKYPLLLPEASPKRPVPI